MVEEYDPNDYSNDGYYKKDESSEETVIIQLEDDLSIFPDEEEYFRRNINDPE